MLPLPASFASPDRSALAVDVGLQPRPPHLVQKRQSPLPLFAPLACSNPSIITHDVGLQVHLPDLVQQRQGPLPLVALLARTYSSIATIMSGSNFSSHISLSSARARCHWLPFSNALIPAL
ncbi:unnamed protein product [Prorocentrum cordatum]|nr:unnamed protein product [Polarella glacialis]